MRVLAIRCWLFGIGCGFFVAGAAAAEVKAPTGCRPAPDATAGPGGYADRVIHEKTGIELILVPAGALTMGPAKLAYQVTFSAPFYIGKTEVTNGSAPIVMR